MIAIIAVIWSGVLVTAIIQLRAIPAIVRARIPNCRGSD